MLLDILRSQQANEHASPQRGNTSFLQDRDDGADSVDFEALRSAIVMLTQAVKAIEEEREKEMLEIRARIAQLKMVVDYIFEQLGMDDL